MKSYTPAKLNPHNLEKKKKKLNSVAWQTKSFEIDLADTLRHKASASHPSIHPSIFTEHALYSGFCVGATEINTTPSVAHDLVGTKVCSVAYHQCDKIL